MRSRIDGFLACLFTCSPPPPTSAPSQFFCLFQSSTSIFLFLLLFKGRYLFISGLKASFLFLRRTLFLLLVIIMNAWTTGHFLHSNWMCIGAFLDRNSPGKGGGGGGEGGGGGGGLVTLQPNDTYEFLFLFSIWNLQITFHCRWPIRLT